VTRRALRRVLPATAIHLGLREPAGAIGERGRRNRQNGQARGKRHEPRCFATKRRSESFVHEGSRCAVGVRVARGRVRNRTIVRARILFLLYDFYAEVLPTAARNTLIKDGKYITFRPLPPGSRVRVPTTPPLDEGRTRVRPF